MPSHFVCAYASGQFNYGGVDTSRLTHDVSSIIRRKALRGVTWDGTICNLEFDDDLDDQERAQLDALIATHVPVPLQQQTSGYMTSNSPFLTRDGQLYYDHVGNLFVAVVE